MQAAVETVHPPLFRRHARRPRLTRLLDESRAQAILVTAPAGYGKTTLAMEWLQGRDDVVWYRATSASADVAAFSAGLADIIDPLVPGAGDRLKQRLRVADTPERAARPLAELLAEDIGAWPKTALLVIDDYHLLADSAPVEDFFDWLLTLASQLRVLVTSRRRPRWASARRMLYGEITEIGREQLAMNAEEAGRVLEDRSRESVRALVTQAEGWPALIGLAALTASREIPEERVSEALYRYFAEEVVRGETPEVERFMLMASVPSVIDARVVEEVLGIEDSKPILDQLVADGLLHRTGDHLRFHPLLREFLRRRLEREDQKLYEALAECVIADARSARRWEEAVKVARDVGRLGIALDVIEQATADMLASARIETLERWLSESGPEAIRHAGASVARVEVLVRRGHLADAAVIAEELTRRLEPTHPHASRASFLTGQALYLRSGSRNAVEFQRRAKDLAQNSDDLKRALWGLFMAENELGDPHADHHLDELEAMAMESDDLDARLRVAVGREGSGALRGTFAGVWEVASPLIAVADHAADPMARTTFFVNAAYLCVSRADYRQGLSLATRGLNECRELGFEFATGYGLLTLALAQAGLRNFKAAHQSLLELKTVAEMQENAYLQSAFEIVSMRIALARGQARNALVGHDPQYASEIPVAATQGEYLGVLALAASAASDHELARSCAELAQATGPGIEARFFSAFALLLSEYARGRDECDASALIRTAHEAHFVDPFVLAYRASPDILKLVSRDHRVIAMVATIMERANDVRFAESFLPLAKARSRTRAVLTPRELEVLGLLSEGLSNAEIAERLVISPSTAKVHVQHILKKLGAKSRLQAAIQAQTYLATPN